MAKNNLSKIKVVINQYIEELKKYDIRPKVIILYGSQARGTADKNSDIDIVVISEDLEKWPPIERLQILARATMNIDAPLEVMGYTPAEIRKCRKKSIFWDEIEETGKTLYQEAA